MSSPDSVSDNDFLVKNDLPLPFNNQPKSDEYFLITYVPFYPPKLDVYKTLPDLVEASRKLVNSVMLSSDVRIFIFYGSRLYITKGKDKFLVNSKSNAYIPLFDEEEDYSYLEDGRVCSESGEEDSQTNQETDPTEYPKTDTNPFDSPA